MGTEIGPTFDTVIGPAFDTVIGSDTGLDL
jgi:hypothetical protein